METANKSLLLKDLCERQMYNVKCKVFDDANPYTLSGVLHNKTYSQLYFEELDWKECDGFVGVEYCKPYLFPLLSMTEEQKEEYVELQQRVIYNGKGFVNLDVMKYVDWCYKHHIDINGLIPLGLAIDATELDIY